MEKSKDGSRSDIEMNDELLDQLLSVAEAAGRAIMEVYEEEEIVVDTKSDESPVTKADRAAHKVIEASLLEITPEIPILSEEGGLPPFEMRARWDQYWLVDPLDGTKEFINRNGEFTVNIALIRNHKPALGIVYVPVKNVFYFGGEAVGAWKVVEGVKESISARTFEAGAGVTVVASRRHGAEALDGLLERIANVTGPVNRTSMGSSLKLCLVAEGKADWYPRLAPTCEWDTAAAHAIVCAAGGVVLADDFTELEYNRKDSLLNPYFHVLGDPSFDWVELIGPN